MKRPEHSGSEVGLWKGDSRRQLKIITTGALRAGGGHDLRRHHHFCFGSSVGIPMAQLGCSKLHNRQGHRRKRSPQSLFVNWVHLTLSKSWGDKARLFHGNLLSLFLRTSLPFFPPCYTLPFPLPSLFLLHFFHLLLSLR